VAFITNEVRIFISSTFRDFQLERRIIHQEIAPLLEEICKHYGLHLFLSDLRWGVTAHDVKEQLTTGICLEEVENCVNSSPELGFLCLLGERYGSRVLPQHLELHGLVLLLEALEDAGAGSVARAVRALYDIRPTGQLARRSTENETAAENFLADRTALGIFRNLHIDDPAGEAAREAFACSLTHREILRSRALSVGSNHGTIAVLRDHVLTARSKDELPLADASWSPDFVDDGDLAAAQASLRTQVERALGTRVARVTMPVTDMGGVERQYISEFRKAATSLLRDGVERAKQRGTRVHHFVSLGRMASKPDPPLYETVGRNAARAWYSDFDRPARLAIIGDSSSYQASLLLDLYDRAQQQTAPAVYLDLVRRPELSDFRRFIVAALASLDPDALDEATIERLLSTTVHDLDANWKKEIARAAHHKPVLLLINGLDLIRTGAGEALSSLWKDSPGLTIAFTCKSDFEPLRIYPEKIRVILLEALTEFQRHAVIRTELAQARRTASDEELQTLITASEAIPSPDYAAALAQAYIDSDGSPEAGWNCSEPDRFYDTWLRYLIRAAPFSEVVCEAFLGLMTIGDLGITETDFLNVSREWTSVRNAIGAAFPLGLPSQQTPALVWHRLRTHFDGIIIELGIFDEVAYKIKPLFAAAVGPLISADGLRGANEHLRGVLWSQRADPTARVAIELPRFLNKADDARPLAELLLTKSFLKAAIRADRGRALVHALNCCADRERVLAELRQAIEQGDPASIETLSHWLLDLNMILQQLGYATEASAAARRAYQLRRRVLSIRHGLTITAALRATDSYMEAGAFGEALGLGQEVLRAIESDIGADAPIGLRALVNRLRGHLAAAHGYQENFDEAIRLYNEYIAACEPQADADLFAGYNGLTVGYMGKHEFAKALEYSEQALSCALAAFGENGEGYGLAFVNRGGVLLQTGAYADAIDSFHRALAIYTDSFDREHPWRQNAVVGLFMGLAESGRLHEAMTLLGQEISAATTVNDILLWGQTTTRHILAAISNLEPAVAGVFVALHSILQQSTRTPSNQRSRGFSKNIALLAQAVHMEVDDEQGRRGILITNIALWTLATVAAVRCSAISREAGCSLLRRFENQVKDCLGPDKTLLNFAEKFRDCWGYFVPSHPYIQVDIQLYQQLLAAAGLVPDPSVLLGRVETTQQDIEDSIGRLELRLKEAENRLQRSDVEIGQTKILLASKYSSAARHEDAELMQSDATFIVCRRFGKESREHAVALMNLGSVQFAAERWDAAFRSYCDGFTTILELSKLEPFEAFGGAFEKTLQAAAKTGEFRRAAEVVELIASRYGRGGLGINLLLYSAGAWLETGAQMDAVIRFERAVDEFTRMDSDAGPWLEPMSLLARNLAKRVHDAPAQRHLSLVVKHLSDEARARGLSSELESLKGWSDVVAALAD
jgi:tetratricopeptide (TPR) repeat protein